jgi:hypothetical protein
MACRVWATASPAALELRQSLSTTGESIGITYRQSQHLLRAGLRHRYRTGEFYALEARQCKTTRVFKPNKPNMEGNNEEAPFENPVGDGSQQRRSVRAGEFTAEFIVTRPVNFSGREFVVSEHVAEYKSVPVDQQLKPGGRGRRIAVAGAVADSGCADEADAFEQRNR